MDEIDLTKLQFDVYMTRKGPWNPDHGEVEIPDYGRYRNRTQSTPLC